MSSFLEKYGKKKNAKSFAPRVDFNTLKSEKAKDFLKCVTGKKYHFVIVTANEGDGDPFVQWGSHKNLQEVDYYTIPCDLHNKGEKCEACDRVSEMKAEEPEDYKPIYEPIQAFLEDYARVIMIDSETGKMDNKALWFKVPRTLMEDLVKQVENLEKDEMPFFDRAEPTKIILEYNEHESPAKKYSATLKPMRAKDTLPSQKITEIVNEMKPLTYYTPSRKSEDVLKMVDEYITRKVSEIEEGLEKENK